MNWERFFIVGSTATGKSSLALKWAQKHQGVIVNADSLQFFKDLKIGTAYPETSDMEQVPHFLYGICDVGEDFTAGEFVRRYHDFEDQFMTGNTGASEQNEQSKPSESFSPIFIVGGSGFYLKALETGMFPVSQDSLHAPLPKEHEAWPYDKKIDFLKQYDPSYLDKVGTKDIYRIDRAIQLYLAEGKTMTEFYEQMQNQEESFALKLGLYLHREELLKKVQTRTRHMLEQGLIDEVKALLEQGIDPAWKPLASVGYKETLAFLQSPNSMNLQDLEELIVKNTMILAKKQLTWFRGDPEVVWFHADKDIVKAEAWLEEQLDQSLEYR